VAERLIATVLKTVWPVRVTGVRIPPAPLEKLLCGKSVFEDNSKLMATIEIAKPSYAFEDGVHRVTSYLLDKPLCFETSDISLQPSPEAILSAILIPVLESRYDISIDNPLSSEWVSNIEKMSKVFKEWRLYRDIEFHGRGTKTQTEKGQQKTGLCFSGGVDSLYNLLRGAQRIDYLVCAYGYDIELSNKERIASFQNSLNVISEATNTKPITIRTNLREHPISAYASWSYSHGGALAALGHLLNRHLDKLVISASYPLVFDRIWGSHWKTDHLWSCESLEVIHAGAELWRADKLRAIMDEPIVRKHLRVCYKNGVSELNCGCCEKCIRTMLILVQNNKLDNFDCFNNRGLLAESINKLHHVGKDLIGPYQKLLDRCLDKQLAKALESLLHRTRKVHKKPIRILRMQLPKIIQNIKRPFKRKLKIDYL
jgi:hypothetical protein